MRTKYEDMLGKQYGKLTVIGFGPPDEGPPEQVRLICECSCEAKTKVKHKRAALLTGHVRSCGCLLGDWNTDRIIPMIGKVFGRWTVLEVDNETKLLQTSGGGLNYKCQCACEAKTIRTIPGPSLRSGHSKSCGCMKAKGYANNRKYEPRIRSARTIWTQNYNDGDIDFDTFLCLSQMNCDYCGQAPSNTYNAFMYETRKKYAASERSIAEGVFVYNGLDKVESLGKHTKNNVVPCCYKCNWSKSDDPLRAHEEWLIRSYHWRIFGQRLTDEEVSKIIANKVKRIM